MEMVTPQNEEEGALAFFRAQHQAFAETLSTWRGRADMVPALLGQAYSSFEGNVEVQAEGHPAIACHKGCATCCTIRVTATAPEVLMAARYIRAADAALKKAGIDLPQRLAEADEATRGRDERQRVTLRRRCPFIAKGVCVIYPARPLACRGHASYDKRACAEAAAGRLDGIPLSMPHMMVRSLVQNAMQSALRDAGYVWAAYELNHALSIALADEGCEAAWTAGADVFAPALAAEVSQDEMARTFDRIHGRSA
jgi:Fe-S-cluster containining protein